MRRGLIPGQRQLLRDAIGDLRPRLVILDGLTEAFALHGLDPIDNLDAAAFRQTVTTPIRRLGPATLVGDHPPKTWTDQRYAIGAAHRTNALGGVSFVLENVDPIAPGLVGLSRLSVVKDRIGQVRRHGVRHGPLVHVANLHVDSSADPDGAGVVAALRAPDGSDDAVTALRPRPVLHMQRVLAVVAEHGSLSGRQIEDRVKGGATVIRQAVATLVDEGFISDEPAPRNGRLHRAIRGWNE
jgi:hypothetical protein